MALREPLADRQGEPGMSDQEPVDLVALEDRPTGDFIDGYLAALASLNAALSGAAPNTFFYSFDWIGDCTAEREPMLAKAFQTRPEAVTLSIVELSDWREKVRALGRSWLGYALNETQGDAVARELADILEAYFAGSTLKAFEIRPTPAPDAPSLTKVLGVEHDHVLFETEEGRLLLEFSRDA